MFDVLARAARARLEASCSACVTREVDVSTSTTPEWLIQRSQSGPATEEEGVGLAILIDEAQDLTPVELTAVCSAAQVVGQNGWPALCALAGLPSLPRVLVEAKSYAERLFVFERIEHLTQDLAREALAQPAASEGVAWDEAALTHVVQETFVPVLPAAVRPGHLERRAWSWDHPRRRPGWCGARASCLTASSVFAGIVRLEQSNGTCGLWPPTATQGAHQEG